jgi:hypothetical protein
VITALAGPSLQAGHQRLRPEAAEQRHQHRTELEHREEGDEGLGQVGHEQADHVALADAQVGASAPARRATSASNSAVAQRAPFGRVFAFPDEEGLPPARRAAVAVQAVQHDVGGAADAPVGPLDALAAIDQQCVRLKEAEVAEGQHLARQARGVGIGACVQRGPVGHAEVAHEGHEVALRDDFRRGLPGETTLAGTSGVIVKLTFVRPIIVTDR